VQFSDGYNTFRGLSRRHAKIIALGGWSCAEYYVENFFASLKFSTARTPPAPPHPPNPAALLFHSWKRKSIAFFNAADGGTAGTSETLTLGQGQALEVAAPQRRIAAVSGPDPGHPPGTQTTVLRVSVWFS